MGEASVAPAPASDTASAPASATDSSAVSNPVPTSLLHLPPEVTPDALAVDAACSGNPGKMEYRGVYLKTGQVVFHYGPVYGTNNIGEFLAIVHALALLKKMGTPLTIIPTAATPCCGLRRRNAAPLWRGLRAQSNSIR